MKIPICVLDTTAVMIISAWFNLGGTVFLNFCRSRLVLIRGPIKLPYGLEVVLCCDNGVFHRHI